MNTHITSPKMYGGVFVALFGLLTLSVFAAQIEHGVLNLVVGLTIAATKASLIAVVYMGLRAASSTTRMFAIVGIVWLAILVALLMTDYVSRSWSDPQVAVRQTNLTLRQPVAARPALDVVTSK